MAGSQRPTRSTALHGDGQTGGPVFAELGTILRTVLGELLPQAHFPPWGIDCGQVPFCQSQCTASQHKVGSRHEAGVLCNLLQPVAQGVVNACSKMHFLSFDPEVEASFQVLSGVLSCLTFSSLSPLSSLEGTQRLNK